MRAIGVPKKTLQRTGNGPGTGRHDPAIAEMAGPVANAANENALAAANAEVKRAAHDGNGAINANAGSEASEAEEIATDRNAEGTARSVVREVAVAARSHRRCRRSQRRRPRRCRKDLSLRRSRCSAFPPPF